MHWEMVEMHTTFQRGNTFSSLSKWNIFQINMPWFLTSTRYIVVILLVCHMHYYWCILIFIIHIWLNSYYYAIYFYWILLVLCNKRSFNINCRNLGLVEAFTHKQENKICILDNNIYCGLTDSMPTSKGNTN